MTIKRIYVFRKEDFKKWLQKNHDKEKIVELVIHKRHTGKKFPTHHELMLEGISFGWIDTIIRRIDENKFIRTFQRRNEKSSWSQNTLKYAGQLIKEKRMTSHGLAFYKSGKKKKAFDYGIPKNPKVPEDLSKELDKNRKAKENFNNLPKSIRRTYLRWILMGKTQKTRHTRTSRVINRMKEKDWRILKF
ncbi:MAG: YdeI/OmpD-associated family protein [Nanoarchaeota archaeon]